MSFLNKKRSFRDSRKNK